VSKFFRTARRWAGSSTMTKRQGWLSPTEGARHASWIRRSNVPDGSASRRKRRTSRRQTSRSRKRARKASSKSIGLLVAAMEPCIRAFMLPPSTPPPNHHIPRSPQTTPPMGSQKTPSPVLGRRQKQDDDPAVLLERPQNTAVLTADLPDA